MRGGDAQSGYLFSLSPEQHVPIDHPLRPIRQMTAWNVAAGWGRPERRLQLRFARARCLGA
jgi:hypothetical protein